MQSMQSMLGLMHQMAAGEDVGAGFGALLPILGDLTQAVFPDSFIIMPIVPR
ncbi:hypothetical protein OIE13_32150 [Streptosporangium sp. NBC_01810]|nr:hypothetical protein [Streptosporangium sp. NBC_01810]WSA25517.1 hypothetical protein OIE13_32150 [Streptosporangium sp. NBC_01810]